MQCGSVARSKGADFRTTLQISLRGTVYDVPHRFASWVTAIWAAASMHAEEPRVRRRTIRISLMWRAVAAVT